MDILTGLSNKIREYTQVQKLLLDPSNSTPEDFIYMYAQIVVCCLKCRQIDQPIFSNIELFRNVDIKQAINLSLGV